MSADDWLIEAARAGMRPSPYDGKGDVPIAQVVSPHDDVTEFYKNAQYSVTPQKPLDQTTKDAITEYYANIARAGGPTPFELPDYEGCLIHDCDWYDGFD